MDSIQSTFALIFSPDRQKVLMVERRDLSLWEFPGGGLDKGESPEAGVIRETKEETGFDVEVVRPFTILNLRIRREKIAFFECKIVGGVATLSSETKNIQFFPIHNIPKMHSPLCPLILKTRDKEKTLGIWRFLYLLARYLISRPKLVFLYFA
jgi:8-oxo-dGTP pyrophosphatase MutT (NUDIX family)